MRRGEIWRYQPAIARPGHDPLRLLVSADFINADDGVPTDPGGLMAIPVRSEGWAWALSLEPVQRRRLVEHVGTASAAEMDQVNNALRAVQDL